MIADFQDNSLLSFQDYFAFKNFYSNLEIYDKWKISSGSMNSRGECIRHKRYSLELQSIFKEKGMFRKNVSIAEIVSWLDSFIIINNLFELLKEYYSKEIILKIGIFSEYVIKMSKKMRVDYILQYEGKVLLIELRMVSNFNKIKTTWNKKKMELLIYKELMGNYIPSHIKIYTFALVVLPEYDMSGKISKHIEYNSNQVNFLKKYIDEFIIK